MEQAAPALTCDDIALMLRDNSSFLAALEAMRKNMTGPPSQIFTVPSVWPLVVAVGTRVGPKMREDTLQLVESVLNIAQDLYALSAEQRAALTRYKEAIDAARKARTEKKNKPAVASTDAAASPGLASPGAGQGQAAPSLAQQPHQAAHHPKRHNGARDHQGRGRGGPAKGDGRKNARRDDSLTPEAIARAARQAELFAQHDIAREQVRATLCHHPLRVPGQALLSTDLREVLMGDIGGPLRVGQLVAVPRSTGGLCYGELVGPFKGERCYWQPSMAHEERLVRVSYGNKQKSLPSSLLGRLSMAPGPQNSVSEIERGLQQRPRIGDTLSTGDAATIQLGCASKFQNGELVAVPRSFGGFTVGKVDGLRGIACPSCPASNTHQVPAYRVVTEEADDESPAKSKLIAAGVIGKLLAPWAAQQRQDLLVNPVEASTALHEDDCAKPHSLSSSGNGLRDCSLPRDESNVDDVEKRLRERFGDFTPFLDDEDDSAVALQELEPPMPAVNGAHTLSSSAVPVLPLQAAMVQHQAVPFPAGPDSQWNSFLGAEPLFFGGAFK